MKNKLITFIKKNNLLCIILAIFLVLFCIFMVLINANKLKGKVSNGETVVYSINNQDVTATELYDSLENSGNYEKVYITLAKKAIADESVKTTNTITSQVKNALTQLKQNYTENELNSQVQSSGYDDINDYLTTQFKLNYIGAEYAANHFDELQIKYIRYILIPFEDTNNPTDTPTDSEQSKMNKIDKALADGETFADCATQYSEDTSTATNGGLLGTIDKNASNNLDSVFFTAAITLNEEETSDWVRSDSFGYFKIYCEASTPETLEQLSDSAYTDLVSNYDSTVIGLGIYEKAKELNIDFHGNTYLENAFKSECGITESEAQSITHHLDSNES